MLWQDSQGSLKPEEKRVRLLEEIERIESQVDKIDSIMKAAGEVDECVYINIYIYIYNVYMYT